MNNEDLGAAISAAYDALDRAAKALDAVRKMKPVGYEDDVLRKANAAKPTPADTKAPFDLEASIRRTAAIATIVETTMADLSRRLDRLEQAVPARPSTVARR